MEKALKVLGLLSLVLWASLAGLIVSCIYFASTGQFLVYIGEPFSIEYDGVTKYIIFVHVVNKGVFDIINFNLKASLLDGKGQVLCENSTRMKSISPGTDMFIRFVVCLSDSPVGEGPLNLTVVASMVYAYIFPMRVSAHFMVEAPGPSAAMSTWAQEVDASWATPGGA